MNPYLLALMANLSFALGSMFFTHYAKKFSALWMNCVKATVAFLIFGVVVLLQSGFHEMSLYTFCLFFISGFVALGIGDVFLVKAFTHIGPARTLVLFGFQPVVIGVTSFIVFDQGIQLGKGIGILFFILCLGVFSYERLKKSGHWDLAGIGFALLGMLIDGLGVIVTRMAFDSNTAITGFEGNFYRCLGALASYLVLSIFFPFNFIEGWKSLGSRSKFFVILGSFFGTFLSLALYLEAIKTAHLASLSAIAITGVIFTSIFESVLDKKLPNKYLLVSFVFFLIGMYFILWF